ncbi:MAG: hypothetical protein ACE5JS_05115 [Nitrospinota bacterium]
MKARRRSLFWGLAILGPSLAVFLFFPVRALISANSWIGQPAPPIQSRVWLNSEPLDWGSLRGKVVLVDMWTFG